MAPGIYKTFKKAVKDNFNKMLDVFDYMDCEELALNHLNKRISKILDIENLSDIDKWLETARKLCKEEKIIKPVSSSDTVSYKIFQKIIKMSYKDTEKACYQAMEGFVHNLNSLHSRAGGQVPFSSINLGTDISEAGRMVTKNLLLALEAGLGYGETCIFPIVIFKIKEGVNYFLEDPNYDLLKLSYRVTAKRLFPNYVFLDSPFNLQYYKPGHPETEVATMGKLNCPYIIEILY